MHRRLAILAVLWGSLNSPAANFRVATYNLENYLDHPTESRRFIKSEAAKAKIRESIRTANPDVLALEEMGTTNALLELRDSLRAEGCEFPFWEHVTGFDTNIHVAILSRLPILSRHPHTNDSFLLDGRRVFTSRGFAEAEIQAAKDFTFTLIVAHLKSRRPSPVADEAEQRLQEAKILRGMVDEHFKLNPNARLIVLGDFNDVKNSPSTKEIIGRGKFKLTDTRPAERNGDTAPNPVARFEPRNVAWTQYYGLEDTYSRIDYILFSPALAQNWKKSETYIATVPNWGLGSDHRPILASFTTAGQ